MLKLSTVYTRYPRNNHSQIQKEAYYEIDNNKKNIKTFGHTQTIQQANNKQTQNISASWCIYIQALLTDSKTWVIIRYFDCLVKFILKSYMYSVW